MKKVSKVLEFLKELESSGVKPEEVIEFMEVEFPSLTSMKRESESLTFYKKGVRVDLGVRWYSDTFYTLEYVALYGRRLRVRDEVFGWYSTPMGESRRCPIEGLSEFLWIDALNMGMDPQNRSIKKVCMLLFGTSPKSFIPFLGEIGDASPSTLMIIQNLTRFKRGVEGLPAANDAFDALRLLQEFPSWMEMDLCSRKVQSFVEMVRFQRLNPMRLVVWDIAPSAVTVDAIEARHRADMEMVDAAHKGELVSFPVLQIETENYILRSPESSHQTFEWGQSHNNCLGGYAQTHLDRNFVLGIWDKGTDIENHKSRYGTVMFGMPEVSLNRAHHFTGYNNQALSDKCFDEVVEIKSKVVDFYSENKRSQNGFR